MNMREEYKYCILASISMVGSILITIYTSVLMGDAIDYATVGNVEKLLRACGIIFSGTILSNVWFVFSVWLNECFKKRVVIRLRDVFAKELLKRPLSVFRRKEDAYYINIYSNDIDRLGTNYYEMLALEWKFLSLIAGAVVAMTLIQPGLLVISLVFALLPILARVLLRKTKILILDEPVTGLDSENKAIINNYIFGLKDVTKIVVTHDTEEEYLSKFDGVIHL